MSLTVLVRSVPLVGGRRGSEERCRWSVETGDDSEDSQLVWELDYCLVEAVGCCWSGTGNNNIIYNS